MYKRQGGEKESSAPLASRLRPRELSEFSGQTHLLGEGKVLRQLIDQDQISSMIFWGPPGVGKTTLARIIANRTRAHFINFSAVTSGIKEIKEVMAKAEASRRMGERTILFVDEIHRFNKAQQDAFLPYVEKGSIILIGATTENPSFEINSALLSRCKVFVLNALSEEEIVSLLKRALADPRGFGGQEIDISGEILSAIAVFSNGDARTALNTLEMVILNSGRNDARTVVTRETLEQCTSRKSLLYDKKGEEHYNIISALHKSMRNSDVDAAIYWLARMLEAGEDPLYVARRLVRFASEDVGMAAPAPPYRKGAQSGPRSSGTAWFFQCRWRPLIPHALPAPRKNPEDGTAAHHSRSPAGAFQRSPGPASWRSGNEIPASVFPLQAQSLPSYLISSDGTWPYSG